MKNRQDDWEFIITAIYGPNNRTTKVSLWEEITEIGQRWNLPWVTGDFNIVRFTEERGGGDTNVADGNQFNNTIRDLQLMDLLVVDKKYTWSSLRESPSLAKLDRILVSPEWEYHYPLAVVQACHRLTSDHVPLNLIIGGNDHCKKRQLRFEKMWMKSDEIGNIIKRSWELPTRATDLTNNFVIKLRRLRTT